MTKMLQLFLPIMNFIKCQSSTNIVAYYKLTYQNYNANYSMLNRLVYFTTFATSKKFITMQKTTILEVFGQNVRRLRVERGLSQEQLADKAGLHRTYIGMIERAEKNITLCNMEKVAVALGVSVSSLI